MDSDVNGATPAFEAYDLDSLRQEDCQYVLRALEKRAFEYVVCALRAQGPLSQYKEVVLDHLKSLLFISDDDFLLRVRLTANDPVLTRIAQELNPSYDISSEWMAAGYSLVSMDFPKIVQLNGMAPNAKVASIAEKMQLEMAKHNLQLVEEQNALLKLLHLSKKPYVPEKLRRLLQDSEKDTQGRIDTLREKTISKAAPPRVIGRPRRSGAVEFVEPSVATDKTKHNKEVEKLKLKKESMEFAPSKVKTTLPKELVNSETTGKTINKITACSPPGSTTSSGGSTSASANSAKIPTTSKSTAKTSVAKSTSKSALETITNGKSVEMDALSTVEPPTAVSNEASACAPGPSGVSMSSNVSTTTLTENGFAAQQKVTVKTEETENNKALGEFSIHYSGGANVVVVDPEDQNTVKEPKARKRRSKVVDDVTCTCARVLPFIFEAAVDGQTKPPRGNPDKRCSKLKTSKRVQGYTSTNNNDLINFNYVPQQQMGLTPPNSYYSQKNVSYFNSISTITGDLVPSKRIRADESEDNRMVSNVYHQKPQHHSRLIGTPVNIMTNSPYIAIPRSSYYSGAPSTASSCSMVTSGRPPAPQHSTYGQSTCSTNNSDAVVGELPTYNSDHYYAGNVGAGGPRMVGSSSSNSSLVMSYGGVPSDMAMDDAIMVTYGGNTEETVTGRVEEAGKCIQSPSGFTTPSRHPSRRLEHADGSSVIDRVTYTSTQQQPYHEQQQKVTQDDSDLGDYPKNISQAEYHRSSSSSTVLVHSQQFQQDFMPNNSKEYVEKQNNESGLDFLASTASLLIPMQKQQTDNQIDQEQFCTSNNVAPTQTLFAMTNQPPQQQMIYIRSSAPATVIHQQNKYGESSTASNCFTTLPATVVSSMVGVVPTAAQQQSPQLQWTPQEHPQQQPVHHPTTFYHQSAASVISSSDPPTVTLSSTVMQLSTGTAVMAPSLNFSGDNEAAQNFLKQHASLVDTNGVLLNEEITLGSILRSSNLRNKLLSAAGKSSSASPSPSANSPASASSTPTTTTSAVGTNVNLGAVVGNAVTLSNVANQSTSSRQSQTGATTISVVRSGSLGSGLRMDDLHSVPFETTREFVVLSEGVAPTSAPTAPPVTVSSQEN